MNTRIRIAIGVVLIVVLATSAWLWATAGRETTDDAQVDAHVTPIAARVGGTVLEVRVKENQQVEAGAVLVGDRSARLPGGAREGPRRAGDRRSRRRGGQGQRADHVDDRDEQRLDGARWSRAGARQASTRRNAASKAPTPGSSTAQARQREAEANATRTAKDVERFKGLLAKDEISQQQYDAAVAAADGARAAADSARSQVQEAQSGIQVAQSQLAQARATTSQATAQLQNAQSAPQQVEAIRAHAASADAKVQQQRAAVKQAELNLQYAIVKAPTKGVVSKKGVEVGQVVQPGQPLMALVPLEDVWVTANFKETQLEQHAARPAGDRGSGRVRGTRVQRAHRKPRGRDRLALQPLAA